MPSLLSTSRTSVGLETNRFWSVRDLIGRSAISGRIELTRSPVITDGARALSAALDRLARPERASRRSVTPTPRFTWLSDANERFSMCISVGATLATGFIGSEG
jgi:hypothetical protein